jgi:hypothetical protein
MKGFQVLWIAPVMGILVLTGCGGESTSSTTSAESAQQTMASSVAPTATVIPATATPVPAQATSTPNWTLNNISTANDIVKAWLTGDRKLYSEVADLPTLPFTEAGRWVLTSEPEVVGSPRELPDGSLEYDVHTQAKLPDGKPVLLDTEVLIEPTTHRGTQLTTFSSFLTPTPNP